MVPYHHSFDLVSNKNVVNGDVNQFDKETNESHNEETNRGRPRDHQKFFAIRLGAFLDQVHGILGELFERFNKNLVESFLF